MAERDEKPSAQEPTRENPQAPTMLPDEARLANFRGAHKRSAQELSKLEDKTANLRKEIDRLRGERNTALDELVKI
ncbi:hypothetical protein N0V84_003575 [Fusarium piperis]|uniref:Nucleotide exchange factor GrpE n=1 Tax=Fusarium piperis TaxID=1435070 RepID=A0A9W8WH50_9HYPO|nr:hypothetical protein N0V84_003575 [Fusarium piperis]